MAKIREVLQELNPWWKGKFILEFKERQIYKELQEFMPMPQMIAITGLRRVGKTTLMRKIIDDELKRGFDPKSIMYFSFDEFKDVEVREVIREYEDLTQRRIQDGKYLLLLDEIQKLSDWENQIKGVYDTFGKNVKIILSGSESLFIKNRSKETLAGRIFMFEVEPLSFKEFLYFKGVDFEPIGVYEGELLTLFNEFTLTLGFPEMVGISEKRIIERYVKESIVERVVYKDIQKLFGIKDVSVIESLLNILMDEPGQILEMSGLASELNISRQTLSNYMTYLEESFLVRKLYNFSRNRRKTGRKLKRYYPAVISVDLLFRDDDLSKSRVFEWNVVNQLNGEFFWRDSYKNEVDVILPGENPMPVEIKYGKLDMKGLKRFMDKFGVGKGYIISYNRQEEHKINGRVIRVVPAFKFLLSQDNYDAK